LQITLPLNLVYLMVSFVYLLSSLGLHMLRSIFGLHRVPENTRSFNVIGWRYKVGKRTLERVLQQPCITGATPFL
jgi:hypothetical protein